MNSAERSPLMQVLHGRCHTIADSWYKAIVQTSFIPYSAAEVRQRLVGLTEQVIALLLMERFEHDQARTIGASVAGLVYAQPEALGRTQEILTQQLVKGLSAEQVAALHPRLAALLGGLAAGFSRQVRETTLTEQERIRSAVIAELRQAQEALRKAYEEVEQQVQDRTAELRATNEALQHEIAERKRAEEALRNAARQWHATFDAISDAVCLLNPEGIILRCNVAMKDLLGKPFSEIVGYPCYELVCGTSGPIEGCPVVRMRESRRRETLVLPVDGRWFNISVDPVLDEAGNLAGAVHIMSDITERKRAEEEIKRHNRELSALNSIAATVSKSLDLGEVLSDALDKVLEMMELEVGAIRLLDEQGRTLDLMVHRGVDLSPQVAESISRAKLAEGPLAEVVATGEPLIEDISAHPMVKLIGRRGLKSLAVIPLKSKGRVLGTMEAASLDPRQFTSEEMQLLTSIGNQIGLAIENATLYKEAQNSADQATSLFEISQSLTSSLDLNRTLRLIVEQATKLLETDLCSLFLYDRDTDELLGQVRYGVSDEELGGARVPLSDNQTAAEAKATLKPVVVEDTTQDHRMPAEIVEKWGIRSSLTVPLVIEGRFLGVIFLSETKDPRRFTANEIELAQSFASQAAIALDNAQLHAHSEELAISRERNRIAREIHDDLSQRLASLLMRVDLCLELIDEEPEETKRELDKIGVALQDSIQEARRSIFALRPLTLEQLGFRRALCTYVDDFAHQNEISVHLSLPEEGGRLPAKVEYTLFRIVQEALANVRWHAQADNVWIELGLRSPGRICLEIRDDGHGLDIAKRVSDIPGDDDRGMGLLYMRERVEGMRGSFRMEAGPTAGTKITVTLPLEG